MATKFDDFGRPIYETAEEYNKAQKAKKQYSTYTSVDGDAYKQASTNNKFRHATASQRHAAVKSVRRTKAVTIGIIVAVLVTNLLVIFSSFSMSENVEFEMNEEEVLDDWTTGENGYEEDYLMGDINPLPEGFEKFTYNGQSFQLPSTVNEILQAGFILEENYDEEDEVATDYEELLFLSDEEHVISVMIRAENYTGDDLMLGECSVSYFSIENSAAYSEYEETPDFEFAEGFTFETTYDELEAYFGIPYHHYEDHTEEGCYYDSYEWAYYGEDEIHNLSVTFWNGVISNVGIDKRAMIEY